ncbi:oxygen-insensitive NADPH nitroreductase [Salicibibacter kimchii]|uniref:Oxygen-insensitive NADPH nitroreductase n=1 Tax=Salicibibacter kimchii TaxID=2099786 RepID=A0A345BXQ0_9BACI|nr:oxygen-insensitive NADPH nitroreductase [Salicibibacter kimchii]AXF55731.1 oxygen-insensitive NADPH nitroreductase [Salicibibacter kimchii]
MDHKNSRDLIQTHQSIRKFKDTEVSEDIVTDLVESARWAPTSHHVQAYTMIRVRDQEKRDAISEVAANQKYVRESPLFLVFVADWHKHVINSEKHDADYQLEETENVLVGAVDVALAAENVLLTARSYGLGGVMIGGVRNDLYRVAELLELPKHTFPVMGLCLGYPDQDPGQKPRFPKPMILHEDRYQGERYHEGLDEYERVTSDYYEKRTNGKKTDGWGANMVHYLGNPRRQQVTTFLKDQGFTLK